MKLWEVVDFFGKLATLTLFTSVGCLYSVTACIFGELLLRAVSVVILGSDRHLRWWFVIYFDCCILLIINIYDD